MYSFYVGMIENDNEFERKVHHKNGPQIYSEA